MNEGLVKECLFMEMGWEEKNVNNYKSNNYNYCLIMSNNVCQLYMYTYICVCVCVILIMEL